MTHYLTIAGEYEGWRIPMRELTFEFSRSSGPGGQNVNKVNSKASLRWLPRKNRSLPEDVRERFLQRFASRIHGDGSILISSQRYRDQGRNTADCLEKLRAMVGLVARPPKKRRPTRPSHTAKQRRLNEKSARKQVKQSRRAIRANHGGE